MKSIEQIYRVNGQFAKYAFMRGSLTKTKDGSIYLPAQFLAEKVTASPNDEKPNK